MNHTISDTSAGDWPRRGCPPESAMAAAASDKQADAGSAGDTTATSVLDADPECNGSCTL